MATSEDYIRFNFNQTSGGSVTATAFKESASYSGTGNERDGGTGVYYWSVGNGFCLSNGGTSALPSVTWAQVAASATSALYKSGSAWHYANFSATAGVATTWLHQWAANNATYGTVSRASRETHTYFGDEIVTLRNGNNSSTATAKAGCVFLGWYVNGTKVTATGSANNDIYLATDDPNTLYIKQTYKADVSAEARFAPTYTVAFNANGGSGTMAGQTFTYGVAQALKANAFTRTGYTFAGWKVNNAGSLIANGADGSALSSTPGASVALYAQWTAYTVTYDAHGGSACPSGSGVVTLPATTRTGYTFNGWYTAASGGTKVGTAGASYTPTANVTLHAQWTVKTYDLLIRPLYGTYSGSTANKEYPKENSPALTYGSPNYWSIGVATRTGYTFGGWYLYNNGLTNTQVYGTDGKAFANAYWAARSDGKFNYVGDIDLDVGAKWTANTYTVTLDRQSGTGGTTSVTATYGSAMPTATMPTRTGYTFGGYYTSTGGGGTQYYTAAGASARNWDKTAATKLYAKWTANTYTVAFNANGGSGAMAGQTFTYGVAQALKANAFTRTGYTFAGWATSAGGAVEYANGESVSNLTATDGATVNLYAKWAGASYQIKFDMNGGGTRANQTAYYAAAAEIAAPAGRVGWAFAGWSASNVESGAGACWGTEAGSQPNAISGASGEISHTGVVYVKNLRKTKDSTATLTAQWRRITHEVTVVNSSWRWAYAITGEGVDATIPAKTGNFSPSATFTVLAGATYTLTATMTSASYPATNNRQFIYPVSLGGYNFSRRAGSASSPAVFAATTGVIPNDYGDRQWDVSVRTVTMSIGSNPLSETLAPTTGFADGTTTNVLVTAAETAGSSFLNWSAVSPAASEISRDGVRIVVSTASDVTMTANYELRRVAVNAAVDAASQAVFGADATSGWTSVTQTVDGVESAVATVGYGQSATWKMSGTPGAGYGFAGWYNAAGEFVGAGATHTVKNITAATTLYAKFTATVGVQFEALSSHTLSGAAGHVILAGETSQVSRLARPFVIGGKIVIEAVPNAGENMFFAGWYLGVTKEGSQRMAFTARQEIEVGANADYCAYFRDTADIHYVAIYSRAASDKSWSLTSDFDVQDAEGIENMGEDSARARAAYTDESGFTPLDGGGDVGAVFLRVTGIRRLVVDTMAGEGQEGG